MKKYIFGNWKMNLNIHEASLFTEKLKADIKSHADVEVAIFPGFLALEPVSLQLHREHTHIKLGAQNCYWRDEGAYTGEVSATQLRGLVKYVLVGHSERRNIFREDDREIRFKVQAALRNGLIPVLCVGETEFERNEGDTVHVLNDQVAGGLLNVGTDEVDRVIIAYEPVWAIGRDEPATPREIEDAAKTIRAQVSHMFGRKAGAEIPVLYGGSTQSDNAEAMLVTKGVDGLLIGRESLIAPRFAGMVDTAHAVASRENDNEKGKAS